MYSATYPVVARNEQVTVTIGTVEPDPRSPNSDQRVQVRLVGLNQTTEVYVHGIDPLQCWWLALLHVKQELNRLETQHDLTFAYTPFTGTEGILKPPGDE